MNPVMNKHSRIHLDSATKVTVKKKQPRKRRRYSGWISVNVAKGRVHQIRTLAKCQGITFRTFCECALGKAMIEATDRLGIKWEQIYQMPPHKIESLATRSKLLRDHIPSVFQVFRN